MKVTQGVGAPVVAEVEGLGVFGATGVEGLEGLLSQAELVELPSGDTLIGKGSQLSAMYVLLSGELRVHLDEDGDHVAEITPGDTVGELSVLDRQPASATVVASEQSRLLRFDEQTFWGLVQVSHAFALTLLSRLASRLRANNETVLEKEALRRHFEQAALNDALTGVRSRRWLEDRLPRLLARHERDAQPIALAMVDVDHFKRFNDEHGHQAGDEVLRSVAQTLASRLRPTDLVARYGGEEFAVILPRTDLAGAVVAADRVRGDIAAAHFDDAAGNPLPRVTISVGIALADSGEHAHALIARADTALYAAKEAGRNRVQTA